MLVSLVFALVIAQEIFVYGQEAEPSFSHVIEIPDLNNTVHTQSSRDSLIAEFHSISAGQRKSWLVASLPENIKKNRYDDLLAFDETRVVLDFLPDDLNSDYINANYIDGYNRDKEYVATQGPLLNTINDFWRMIWQLNTHKIIMLANVIEHGQIKVEKYWPEYNNSYGQMIVSKISEHHIGNQHVLRTFLLKKSGEPETRVVKQFHFTGWPDMGVPSERLSVVALVQQARKYRPDDTTPFVIHCSAGVGRTGTVILMDSMMERAKAENNVDFPQKLDRMRDQRVDVVEKEAQYIFAHEAVNDVFNDRQASLKYLQHIDDLYRGLSDENSDEENARLSSSGSTIRSFIQTINPLNYI